MRQEFDLLRILRCTNCKGLLEKCGMFLVCKKCELAYPIVEGIPDMLVEDAWKMSEARKANFKHNLKL